MKERIIGATVLVVFVVLVVPIFLDGPPSGGETVSERVLLPGQEDQEIKTVVLERERSEPIPVASSTADDVTTKSVPLPQVREEQPQPRPQPVQAEEPSRTEPEPEVEPEEAPPSSTTGMFAVQMGSFSNKANAEKLAADLKKQGYMAFLSQIQTPSGQLHRVRIGPQKDRESAEIIAAGLLKVNRKGQVVPHP